MISKIELNGFHLDLDEKISKYVYKKLGKLDKYIPKKNKTSAHLEVFLRESKNAKNHAECEAILFLPKDKIIVKEKTINIFAAVDIVEEKLKKQIIKYKETQVNAKALSRFSIKRRFKR